MKKARNVVKVIFNPHAGLKRQRVSIKHPVMLEDIKKLLKQYQIGADYFPTKGPEDGVRLAKEAKKQGYKMVIVAGGDGTVAEVASGLINTDIVLAILPVGSVMNVARMLAIPFDLEKAVELIKICRVRKIDVGAINILNGQKLKEKKYFLEKAGVGLDAQVIYYLIGMMERGENNFLKIIKTLTDFYGHKAKIVADGKEITTRATILTVSNGPLGWGALNIAAKAKLNDHRLTVNLFKMTKLEITFYLLNLIFRKKTYSPKITTLKATKISVHTEKARLVHSDSRFFGTTPVEFQILPGALNVIFGFPTKGTSSLSERTPILP